VQWLLWRLDRLATAKAKSAYNKQLPVAHQLLIQLIAVQQQLPKFNGALTQLHIELTGVYLARQILAQISLKRKFKGLSQEEVRKA